MNNLRKIVILITSTMAVLLGLFSFDTVSAASYDTNTLASYGIPDNVIQVLLDNSLDASGSSPASKGLTPANFTIGELEKLTTVSLANRGTDESTPNDTVANWVAGLSSPDGYDVADNIYALNTDDKVTGDSGSLATKQITVDGGAVKAPFNFLMQIIASDNAATTVDLTGITSKVTNVTLVQQLLSLFQTDRLSSLQKLVLAHNNLSSTTFYKMASTTFSMSGSQKITTLDLSDNGMDGSQDTTNSAAFDILAKLENFNLAGNSVKTVNGWISAALTKVIANRGAADLSDGNLDADDWNTLNTLMLLLNTGNGDIKVSDAVINNLIQTVFKRSDWADPNWEPTESMINHYLPQLTKETIQKLIDRDSHVKDNPDLLKKLQDKLGGSDNPSVPSSLSVTGSLDFGTVQKRSLNQAAIDITAPDTLTVDATLNSHETLKASVDSWTGTDGNTFTSSMTLPKNDNWAAVQLGNSAKTIFTNSSDTVKKINQSIQGVSLTIPLDQQGQVKTEKYTTKINWTVDQAAASNQN